MIATVKVTYKQLEFFYGKTKVGAKIVAIIIAKLS